MLKIAVLVSGNGTNLEALFDAQKRYILRTGHIVQVISNNPKAYALKRAKKAGVRADVAKTEEEILNLLRETKPGIIVLAGYLKILSADFLKRCDAIVINIHPSLIPSFCGLGMYGLKVHEAALNYGVKLTGATVHVVNEIPDGGKILAQMPVKVEDDDTPEILQQRVLEEAEHVLLPRTLEKLCQAKSLFKIKIKYPGRGIVIGTSPSGCPMFAYFITGRSETSTARKMIRAENDGVDIKITGDENVDTSLILYSPVKVINKRIIISNGDQTDDIYNGYKNNDSDFIRALLKRDYEPDAPHYTPRISAMLSPEFYLMSILRRDLLHNEGKNFYQGSYKKKGYGFIFHTYQKDIGVTRRLPSFEGAPKPVEISDNIGEFANNLWNELSDEYKVSLYVRYYSPDFKTYEDRLFNRCDEIQNEIQDEQPKEDKQA